jgi:quercetin dioxygenase-like cupin family protein
LTDREATISKRAAHIVEETPWGRLVWSASGALKNSAHLTVGRCYIDAAHENPRHYHPNCDEVLQVLEGRIEHACGSQWVLMEEGDTISIPAGVVHNARNIGEGQAVLLIAFSSPDRQTVPA